MIDPEYVNKKISDFPEGRGFGGEGKLRNAKGAEKNKIKSKSKSIHHGVHGEHREKQKPF